MKQSIFMLLLVALFASCTQQSGYKIKGKLATEAEGTVYLQQRVDGAYVKLDSAELVNGKFEMEGTVEGADAYYLIKGDRDRKLIFLDNSTFSVKADSTVLGDATIEGGEAQTLYNDYDLKYKRLYNYMVGEYYKARDEKDEAKKKVMNAKVDSLYEDVQLFQETYVRDHPKSPVAAYLATQIQYGRNAEELGELINELDTALAYTQSYKYLADRVEALQKVAVGQVAPDFTQNDKDGHPITLSDVYNANKLTLIDFWASWCGPCRAENPNVVKAYKKYHSKGFTVFGVSLDSNKDRWLKAIEDDGLTWQHVSDLKGWGNTFAREYSVNSIPSNFLINQNGEIVAANVRGDDLLSKLEEMLK